MTGATVTNNGVGIRATAGTVMVETTDLRDNTTAGLQVQDGGIVDAGQIDTLTYDPVNFTGLGISSGQNNFATGYAPGGAQAIVNANTGPAYNTPGPDGLPLDLTAHGNFFFSNAASFIESVILTTSTTRPAGTWTTLPPSPNPTWPSRPTSSPTRPLSASSLP